MKLAPVLATAVFASLIAVPAWASGPAQGPEPAPTYELDKKGQRDHVDFNLPLSGLTDASLKLSQFANRNLIVFYFSAKCPHCQQAFPHVQKLSDELASQGFAAIAVAVRQNTEEDVRGFIRDYGVHIPVFHDVERQFGSNYGTGSIPLVLLVNPKGEYIRYKSFDPKETPNFIHREASLLAKK